MIRSTSELPSRGVRGRMRRTNTLAGDAIARPVLFAFMVSIMMCAAAAAQDVLTVGTATAQAGGVANVPVYVRDVSSTPLGSDQGSANRIQAIAFKVTWSPANAVATVTFSRAGVLQTLTPLYETTIPSSGGLAYVGSFAASTNPIPLTLNATSPGNQIGTLAITLSNQATAGTVTVAVDPSTATLSNQAGTAGEMTSNAQLTVVNGSVTVSTSATSTALTSQPNPSLVGQSVTLTATVTSATPGTITGTVTFKDGGTTLGATSISGGQAVLSTSALAQGTHTLTALYGGDAQFAVSTSTGLSHTVNLSGFGAPPGLVATAAGTNQVNVTWLPVSGAVQYEVYRSFNGGAYAPAGSTNALALSDSGVSPGIAYFYKVRALDSNSNVSAFSAPDAALTMVFTDDPVVGGVTRIKAVHMEELRTAVNKLRASAGLAPATFSNPPPTAGSAILRVHLTELRTALDAARLQAGLSPMTYSDLTITSNVTAVKAAHVNEVRNGVK